MSNKEKTLRDEFAMAALPACIAEALKYYNWRNGAKKDAISKAYEMADAMMEARKEQDDE